MRRPASLVRWALLRSSYALRRVQVPVLPVAIDVEPINVCNFRCTHCQVTHWSKPRSELTLEAFRNILDQLPGLWRVKLQGMGEPFLSRALVPMLEAGEARGVDVAVVTNGSALTERTARRLAALRCGHVVVSMDGASASVFEQVRVGGRFDQVVANTRRLVQLRNGARRPVVGLHSVLDGRNAHQVADLVRLCAELGADALTFQLAVTDWGKQAMRPYTTRSGADWGSPRLRDRLAEAEQLARALGVALCVTGAERFSRSRPCAVPWTTTFIAANGDVVPCCLIADADTARMGNVFQRRLSEIWNGLAYRELRDRLRRHDLPSHCRTCYADPPGSAAATAAAEPGRAV